MPICRSGSGSRLYRLSTSVLAALHNHCSLSLHYYLRSWFGLSHAPAAIPLWLAYSRRPVSCIVALFMVPFLQCLVTPRIQFSPPSNACHAPLASHASANKVPSQSSTDTCMLRSPLFSQFLPPASHPHLTLGYLQRDPLPLLHYRLAVIILPCHLPPNSGILREPTPSNPDPATFTHYLPTSSSHPISC